MRHYVEANRIFKDPIHSKISGVCAGLANHWGMPRFLVRFGAIVCLVTFPTLTALAYVTATLLIPNR